jgi:hypothetical protein
MAASDGGPRTSRPLTPRARTRASGVHRECGARPSELGYTHFANQVDDLARDRRSACGCRLFQLQQRRKPRRCQAITVSGLTISRADRPLSTVVRAKPKGVCRRRPTGVVDPGWPVEGLRPDAEAQESPPAAWLGFEILVESKKATRKSTRTYRLQTIATLARFEPDQCERSSR